MPVSNCQGFFGGVASRALWLAAGGLCIGAAHSWLQPVVLSAGEPAAPAPAAVTPAQPAPVSQGTPGASGAAPASPAAQPPAPPAAPAPAPTAALGFEVSLEQVKALYDTGEAIFIDARSPAEFALGHIAGAMNVPSDNITAAHINELMSFGLNQRIVLYCGGGDCHASKTVAAILKAAGFTTLHEFSAGFPAWQSAGYDVLEGDQ